MPARWEDVTWMPFPQEHDTPAGLLRQALASGKSWRTLLNEGADGIGTHEIGHTIAPQLRIYPPTQWLNELLASYLGYAYVSEMHLDEVMANQLFWRAGLTGSHPYTALSDFEQHPELAGRDPANYGWYQCGFDQRVIEVYRQSGLDFIRRLQQAFPLDGPELDTEATLNKLEALSPGWRLWADELKSGKVNAVQ